MNSKRKQYCPSVTRYVNSKYKGSANRTKKNEYIQCNLDLVQILVSAKAVTKSKNVNC